MKRFNPLKHIIFTNQNKIKLKLDHFTHEIIISFTKVSNLAYKSCHKILKRKQEMKIQEEEKHKENTLKTKPKTNE